MSLRPRSVSRTILLVAVALAGVFATPGPSHAAGVTITIRDSFDPDRLTVAPGTRVTWVNASGNRHRVRTTSAPVRIDSGNLEPGERFAVTLSVVGTYAYRDEREPDDRAFWATIVVSETAGGSGGGDGSDGSSGGAAALPSSASVGMAGRAFGPSRVTITAGGTVTWRNDDDRAHTASATGPAFDSGAMEPGATFRQTFTSAGSFAYRCVIHPDMTGTIVVRASGAATQAPATPSSNPTPSPSPASPSPEPTTTTPAPTGTDDAAIQVVDFAFEPGTLRIPAGTTLTVTNAGEAPHTMTATDGSFDSGTIPTRGTWANTFASPGSFAYLCAIHPDMTGTLEVIEAAPPATGTDPSPSPAAVAPAAVDSNANPSPGVTSSGGASRVSQPSDYLGLLAGILLTGTAVVLFARTIGGVARRPDDA